MELPLSIGQADDIILAVIGAKGSGKSHYIAVLIEEIRNRLANRLGLSLEPLDQRTIHTYRERFYDPLYRQGRQLVATQPAHVDQEVRLPLVYGLKRLAISGGRTKVRKFATLVFFDTAGETLDDEDTMSIVSKYIYQSHGIIVLLDPLQLSRVREDLHATPEGRHVVLPPQNTETADILTRTALLIARGRGYHEGQLIDTPLAVSLSKFDAVKPIVDPQFQVLASSRHEQGFNRSDFDAVNAEMESLVTYWSGESLSAQIRGSFKRHAYFGLSSLGHSPDDGRIEHIRPWRVEDPFLWLLYENGILPKSAG